MIKDLVLHDLPLPITTPDLILRAPQPGDGKAIHEAMLDGYDDCIKYLCWPATPPSAQAIERDCRVHAAEFILRKELRFVCIEKATNTIIGRFAFPSPLCMWFIPTVGMSYFLRKSAQGKGYATQAANALIRYAFSVLQVKKIEIHCDQYNKKSSGVPQRLNMQNERTQKGTWPSSVPGELANVDVYCCFSTDELPELEVSW